jgi:antitoxin ChpS
MDAETRAALEDFKSRLQAQFGDKLKAVYLFGSRARGDHRPDSDADVAVILDHKIMDGGEFSKEIGYTAYDIFSEYGLYVQPWPLEQGALEHPENFWGERLSRTVLKDGVAL